MMEEFDEDNILHVQTIIENYDKIVQDLKEEIYAFKIEQDNLKSQLGVVLSENKQLSQDLHNALNSKQNPFAENRHENKEIIDNLRQQINTLITEKECVSKLWQDSVKTIDFLEDELKVFQAGTQEFLPKRDVHKLKLSYEEKINKLELTLASTNKKLDETIKQAAAKIDVKHTEIDQSLENQASALKIVKNLESEILKLQKRLHETIEEKNRLDRSSEHKEEIIHGLKKKNSECWAKVTEAVSLVEAALNEKDAALFREKESKEENEKLIQTMTEIVKESEVKIKLQTTQIKNEYKEKSKLLEEELKQAHLEIKSKVGEIDMNTKKFAMLENEIERIQKGHTYVDGSDINKLLVLEKNLESTFQKLLLSEKQNIQLTCEKESIKNDLEQMANLYERTLKAKEIEIMTLKTKITRLETDLKESQEQINTVTEKLSKLHEQIAKTEMELREQKVSYEKGLKITYDRKIEELTKRYNDNVKELHSQIEKTNEINKKWRKETKVISENLEKIISNLKLEIQNLKKENKNVREKLKRSEEKVNQYKIFIELISKDVNKISTMTTGSGAVS